MKTQVYLLLAMVTLSSCIESVTTVNLKKMTSPSKTEVFKASVSQIEVKNNQLIISGTSLSKVTRFEIKGYPQDFQIVEKSESRLVVRPIQEIALKVGALMDFVISSAQASSTIPVQINLDVPGAQVNDFLQFNGTSWTRASINGLNYKGTWEANSGADPSMSAQPGDYYIVSVGGTHSLNGISSWTKGDWVVYADSSTGWQKIDNSMGTFALESLSNITITSPLNNQVLSWNGTRWVNRTLPTETDPSVKTFAKNNLPTCSSGEVLKSDGTSFSCVPVGSIDWSTPGVQTIDNSRINLTGINRVVVTNGSGVPTTSVVTSAELLYLSGVTSNIQTQLNSKLSAETDPSVKAFAKANLPTCAAGEVLKSNGTSLSCVTDATGSGGGAAAFTGTPNYVVATDASGDLSVTAISTTVLGYLSGVTSNVQTQLNSKQSTISKATDLEVKSLKVYGANASNYVEIQAPALSGNTLLKFPATAGSANQVLKTDGAGNLSWADDNSGAGAFTGTANRAVVTDGSGNLGSSSVTSSELEFLSGVTSAIQTQLNNLVTALAGKQATLTSTSDLQGDQVRIYNGANYVELLSPSLSGNVTFTLPSAHGTLNQILKTDASGNLSWTNAGGLVVDWESAGAEVIHPGRLNMGMGHGGKALVTDASSNIVTSSVTDTELGYLSGVTGNIQTQLNGKTNYWSKLGNDIYYTGGKIGVGIASPDTLLHLNNSVTATGDTPFLKFTGKTLDSVMNDVDVTGEIRLGKGMDPSGNDIESAALEFDILGIDTGSGGSASQKFYRFKGNSLNTNIVMADGKIGVGNEDPAALLDIGANGSRLGTLRLRGNTSGYVEIRPSAVAGSWTMKLPGTAGSSGQVLTTDGAGNLSWTGTTIADSSVTYSKLNLTDGDIPQAKVNGLVTALSGKEASLPSGTTAQYLRGDKTLSTFATDVINSTLSGFSAGSNTAITSSDTVLSALEKTQGQLNAKVNSSSLVDWSAPGVQTIEPTRVKLLGSDVVVVTNSSGTLTASSVTTTVLGYLSTISSNVQTQINNLVSSVNALSSQTPSAWEEKTASFTAVKNGRYFVDTSGGAVTMTLPASASMGDTITVIDASGSFDTNNLTVGRNGLRIMGLTEDMTVNNKNISFELVYHNSSNGWRIK